MGQSAIPLLAAPNSTPDWTSDLVDIDSGLMYGVLFPVGSTTASFTFSARSNATAGAAGKRIWVFTGVYAADGVFSQMSGAAVAIDIVDPSATYVS
jgi:hypothetical protein